VPQATKNLLAIKKILRKAGKWITKMRKPFAPKSHTKVKKITRNFN
jgi:hypothetical protein